MHGSAILSAAVLERGVLDPSRKLFPRYSGQFDIGGVSVQISSGHVADVSFGPSLVPFLTHGRICDIDTRVEWVNHLSPARGCRVFDSGSVWRLYERENGFQFDFNASNFGDWPYKRFLIDSKFRLATLQMSQESFARCGANADPLDYPLDELLIMHRLTQEKAIELHGCGIVRPDGTGNLFVGHSGEGKSTTTRLWTEREDVEVLSDDRIIVRREKEKRAEPGAEIPREAACAAHQHEVLRLRDRSASPSDRSAQDDRGMRMYGTPWHGEAMYASPNSADLARIFVLEHGHGNVITRLTPSQAVAELFARSFVPFHRHEYVESALTFLEEVVQEIPVYRYAFEPNETAVSSVADFQD